MNIARTSKLNLEGIAWGLIFVWWGVTELFPLLPEGTGAVGIGLILIGLNAARSWKGIPTSVFTTTLGILALVWGALTLAIPVLHLPFQLPVFAILLIVFGLILAGREIVRPSAA
jgi:hypothetical protein